MVELGVMVEGETDDNIEVSGAVGGVSHHHVGKPHFCPVRRDPETEVIHVI
jgi:hypothetical protein